MISIRDTFVCFSEVFLVLSLLCLGSPAVAEEWINPNGGNFGTGSNWDPPTVPSFSDDAVFDLDAAYTVDFNQDFENESLLINQGEVTFDLNQQVYELTDNQFLEFSIAVGQESGDDATLSIIDGQLIGVRSSIGTDDGAEGMVAVGGAGAEWTNEVLFVGGGDPFPGGTGTLEITGGGTVTNNTGRIANVQGSSGEVTVSGAGSMWDSNFHSVGHAGTGTMDINAGAMVDTLGSTIGFESGSNGTATVSGAGSTWSIAQVDAFRVGRDGTGTLKIEDEGTVESNGSQIAVGEDSSGMVTVSGADSIWTNSGQFIVGDDGDGTLTIEDGSTVESGGSADSIIGNRPNSTGTLTVTGPGSNWKNLLHDVSVGNEGNGTLRIESSGQVSNANGIIGSQSGSTGTVTVNGEGSSWTNGAILVVGSRDDGTLRIENGGQVSNTDGFIGSQSGSTGTATVSGEGSTWTNGAMLVVGSFGDGTFRIENGGQVSNTDGVIGSQSGSTGTATVYGESSTWHNSGTLTVGDQGDGALTIESGGRIENTFGRIGLDDPSGIGFDGAGIVMVTDADSIWDNSEQLYVGVEGPGTLTIADGGSVENTDGVLAQFSRATGTVTVTGPAATWSNSGTLTVGDQGEGTLTIESGGAVENMDASVGLMPDSIGSVTVRGSGSSWISNGTLSIGATSPGCGTCGTAQVTVQAGAMVSVTQDTALNLDSSLHLEGGALATAQIDLQGGEFLWTGGSLHVDQFDDDLTNSAGTLAPGRPPVGTANETAGSTMILGDYTQQSTAVLELEIGGTATGTEHDFVNVSDTAMFGGELRLALINNFVPSGDDQFIVFNADDVLGFFNNAGDGQRVDTVDGIGSFLVHYGPTSAFNPNQIVLTDFEIVNLPADFDNDGDVDGDDLAQWQGDFGLNGMSDADADGDSDGGDFLAWQRHLGSGGAPGFAVSQAVPEPSAALLMLFGILALDRRREKAGSDARGFRSS